ncbi:hypothetical protein GC207_12930 [bacterium]|nr:hypothetical protein [bacterium]
MNKTLLVGIACSLWAASVLAQADRVAGSPSPDRVGLYEVPLVCPADHQIGCGSAAKPILLALEQQSTVSEAWLNRAGTKMAVVWKQNTGADARSTTLKKVLQENGLEVKKLADSSRAEVLKTFLSGQGWYRGSDVDQLSKVEAGVIAGRLVRRIVQLGTLTDDKAKELHTRLADVVARRLTGKLPDRKAAAEQVLKVLGQYFDKEEVRRIDEALKDFHPEHDEP